MGTLPLGEASPVRATQPLDAGVPPLLVARVGGPLTRALNDIADQVGVGGPRERFETDTAEVRGAMGHWIGDPDLAGAGDLDDLAALPEEERAAWRSLWPEVEALNAKSAADQP